MTRSIVFAGLAILLVPALAQADEDPTQQAFEKIAGAVYQGAKERIQTFEANPLTDLPASEKAAAPSRHGIDFHADGVNIRSIPRMGGNRLVELEIPADSPDSDGHVPTFLLWAERKDVLHGGSPSVNVRIPVGRKGDWRLNIATSKTGTMYSLGRTPISRHDALQLLQESGFRPRANLPKEAHGVIQGLGQVPVNVPALTIANSVLSKVKPTRVGKTR